MVRTNKPIREPEFSSRLVRSVEQHPDAAGWGRQRWLKAQLEEKCGETVSPEAISRWFAGEVRPRPKMISNIARVLGVDETWLTMGSPQDRRAATRDGAVNYVAGLIQLDGNHIAFPSDQTNAAQPDIFAIIDGQQFQFQVKRAQRDGETWRLPIPTIIDGGLLLAVVDGERPGTYQVVQVSGRAISAAARASKSMDDVRIHREDGVLKIGGTTVPVIQKFTFEGLTTA